MKKQSLLQKIGLLTIVISFFFISVCSGQEWLDELMGDSKSKSNLFEIQKRAKEYFKHQKKEYFARIFDINDMPELEYEGIGEYVKYKRWEEYWQNHVDENGTPVSPLTEHSEFRKFVDNSPKGPQPLWININRTSAPGGYWGMGRIREIAFHPTDPDIFWAGADQGGIWKTTDNGETYTAVADDLPFLKVSSICVDYTNPDILYMSAGGTNGGWWDRTIGVYKTINGGDSWEATGLSAHLSDYKSYRRLAINPDNPEMLLLTGGEGIYRTNDAAQTWTQVAWGNYYDLVFNPNNGDIVFVGSAGEILKSTNAGLNWRRVSNFAMGGAMRNIAISPVNNKYMIAELDVWINKERHSIIYASNDSGETWTKQALLTEGTGGTIGFSSIDSMTVFRGWMSIFKSTDLGKTWHQKTMWYNDNVHDEVHADHFRIKKNPLQDDRLYFCNDGGVYIYDEKDDKWTERTSGLIISQYYCISSSQSDPTVLLAGSQDNGGWYRSHYGNWRTTNGGDGMHTWQHPESIMSGYSSYPGGKIYRTSNAWMHYVTIHTNIKPTPEDGDWNSRYAIDPNNYNIIVTGCFPDVYRSTNLGYSWTKVSSNLTGGTNLHCVIIPEANSEYIYATAGRTVYKSINSGKDWSARTYPSGSKIKGIVASPYNAEHIWAVSTGFTDGSKVYKSINGGNTWENISGSLPNLPALSIIYEKGTNDGIYIGMTYGIYYRNASMDDWIFYGHGIPNCEIRHLDIQYSSGKLRCATYGRGLYETDLYPIPISAPLAKYVHTSINTCLCDTIQFTNLSENYDHILWDFGDGNTSNSPNPYHAYNKPGSYNVTLTAFNSQLTNTYTSKDKLIVKPYIDPVRVGPEDMSFGSSYLYTGDDAGLFFNVLYPSQLKSVKLFAVSPGSRAIEIRDSTGVLIKRIYTRLLAGENTVDINVELAPGKEYQIMTDGETNLFINTNGAAYPYGKQSHFSITGNSKYLSDHYFFFYDMQVQLQSCDTDLLPDIMEGDNVAIGELLIYPNPVKDDFIIEIKGFDPMENLRLKISSLNGDLILNKEISISRRIELNKNELGPSSQMYIIEIIGTNKKSVSRLLQIK